MSVVPPAPVAAMNCPNGHPANGAPCVAHSCGRLGTTVQPTVEVDAARLLAGVEDCLPWCEACRGLGEYRQGPNRELRPCGYCAAIKRHP